MSLKVALKIVLGSFFLLLKDVCDAMPPESKALELPKELWLLVDHLQKHGLKEVYLLLLWQL